MTAAEALPPSRVLSFDLEQKLMTIGEQARAATDEVFLSVEAEGWHYDYGPEYSEPFSQTISERLEWMAGQAIQEQLSKAILAYWLHQRRVSQIECGDEESIGCLFDSLACIVADLVASAVKGHGASLVGPAEASTEEVPA